MVLPPILLFTATLFRRYPTHPFHAKGLPHRHRYTPACIESKPARLFDGRQRQSMIFWQIFLAIPGFQNILQT